MAELSGIGQLFLIYVFNVRAPSFHQLSHLIGYSYILILSLMEHENEAAIVRKQSAVKPKFIRTTCLFQQTLTW